jgi:hypothetical protein
VEAVVAQHLTTKMEPMAVAEVVQVVLLEN